MKMVVSKQNINFGSLIIVYFHIKLLVLKSADHFQSMFQLEGKGLDRLQKQALNIFLEKQLYFNPSALYELPESVFRILSMIQKRT